MDESFSEVFLLCPVLGAEWTKQKLFEEKHLLNASPFPPFSVFLHISAKKPTFTLLPILKTFTGAHFPTGSSSNFSAYLFNLKVFFYSSQSNLHNPFGNSISCFCLCKMLFLSWFFSAFQIKFKCISPKTLPDLFIFQTSTLINYM